MDPPPATPRKKATNPLERQASEEVSYSPARVSDRGPPAGEGVQLSESARLPESVVSGPGLFGWTADHMIRALQSLSKADLAIVKSQYPNLCEVTPPKILAFYANPLNSPHGRLRTEQEMIETIRMQDFGDGIFIVPVTTRTSFVRYLEKFLPPMFCFVGHCDHDRIAFCDEYNRIDGVPLDDFVGLVEHAYRANPTALETIGIFACTSLPLAKKLLTLNETAPSPTGPDLSPPADRKTERRLASLSHVICWETLTEDGASRVFGQLIMKKMLEKDATADVAFDHAVSELSRQLQAKNRAFGDPGKYRNDWNMHLTSFVGDMKKKLETPPHHYFTVFYESNPELKFMRRIQGCLHCDPRLAGVAVLCGLNGAVLAKSPASDASPSMPQPTLP